MEFSILVEKIKNARPHAEDNGYHKSFMNLTKRQPELFKLFETVYNEQYFARGAIEDFVNKLADTIVKGKMLKKSNDSIKKVLESYLLQYSSLKIDDDDEVLKLKKVSFDIMNNYDDFLFIVKLLDNDFVLTGVVKILIGNLNSELLKKKIYIKNV